MSSPWKIRSGEIITDLICSAFIAGPIKSFPIIGSLPKKVSLPGRQFTRKNPSRPGSRRAGRIFAGKLSAGGRLFWGRSYNGTPALTVVVVFLRVVGDRYKDSIPCRCLSACPCRSEHEAAVRIHPVAGRAATVVAHSGSTSLRESKQRLRDVDTHSVIEYPAVIPRVTAL